MLETPKFWRILIQNSGGYSYRILEDSEFNLAKLINFKYSFWVPEVTESEMCSWVFIQSRFFVYYKVINLLFVPFSTKHVFNPYVFWFAWYYELGLVDSFKKILLQYSKAIICQDTFTSNLLGNHVSYYLCLLILG